MGMRECEKGRGLGLPSPVCVAKFTLVHQRMWERRGEERRGEERRGEERRRPCLLWSSEKKAEEGGSRKYDQQEKNMDSTEKKRQ